LRHNTLLSTVYITYILTNTKTKASETLQGQK